jgi:hypothetical protein
MVVQHFKLQSRFCIDGHLVVEGFLSMGIKNLAWSPKLLISNEATLKFTVHTATVKFGRRHEINP